MPLIKDGVAQPLKELFLHPQYAVVAWAPYGYHPAKVVADAATQSIYFEFRIPPDFLRLQHLHVVIIPTGTGNIYWRLDTNYASHGENSLIHTGAKAYAVDAVTTPQMTELPDGSGSLPGLTKGDYVGVNFTRDATNILDTVNADVYVVGLLVEYEAG